jgi:hypothetical protein
VRECIGTTLPHLHEPTIEMIAVGWGEVRGLDQVISGIRNLPWRNGTLEGPLSMDGPSATCC